LYSLAIVKTAKTVESFQSSEPSPTAQQPTQLVAEGRTNVTKPESGRMLGGWPIATARPPGEAEHLAAASSTSCSLGGKNPFLVNSLVTRQRREMQVDVECIAAECNCKDFMYFA
jgi:hypothetical protein